MLLRDIYKNAFINTKGIQELPHFSLLEEGFILTKIEVLCGLFNIRISSLTFIPINKEIERSICIDLWATSFSVQRTICQSYRRYVDYRCKLYKCDVVFANSISHILSQIIPENDLKKYSRIRKGCAITKTDGGISVVWQPY